MMQAVALRVTLLLAPFAVLRAEDWPTYRHDIQRSGVTAERLDPAPVLLWQHTPQHAPRPSAMAAASTDYWHKLTGLATRATDDEAFHVIAAGDAVYFGSSADDQVHCLDAETGMERWSFFTGGPVRLAPSFAEGRVFFGSDDGHVYCLNANDGSLVWKRPVASESRQFIGNGRMISSCPVRTGVLVDGPIVHVGAGLFPDEGAWLSALRVRDGTPAWTQPLEISPQGHLVASATRLYVPTGRTPPAAFGRADGKSAGQFAGIGGTDVLWSDGLLCFGPGKNGQIEVYRADNLSAVTTFNAHHLVATPKVLFLQRGRQLQALDRPRYLDVLAKEKELVARQKALGKRLDELKKTPDEKETRALTNALAKVTLALASLPTERERCGLWTSPCGSRRALILAGETLYAGGEQDVIALNASDGSLAWTGRVASAACGLAAANGRLLVSTKQGTIYGFGAARTAASRTPISQPAPNAPPPGDWPSPDAMQTVRHIVARTGSDKGFGLVLGAGDGQWAGALARLTGLTVIGIEEDARLRDAARAALDRAGLYGVRASLHSGPLSALPAGFANLVVRGPGAVSNATTAEVTHLLKPYGGVAWMGSSAELIRRRPPPGLGEWTHLYADPGNTACSRDQRVASPTRVQWFGEPGPRPMADRHHRAVAPLFKEGTLFIPAYHRVLAVDAFNGAFLWDVALPDSTRLGAAKDSGYLALAGDALYAATSNECVALDARSGAVIRRFPTPQWAGGGHSWGYTATVGDALFGSGRKKNASFRSMGTSVIDIQYGDRQAISTSDYLFCVDRHTGRPRWNYRGGVIPDPTITLGGGRVYFVESTNAEALNVEEGRMNLKTLLNGGTQLVALDAHTGRVLWRQPADFSAMQHVIFLSYAEQTLVATGSKNKAGTVWYDLFGFDGPTGNRLWHREQNNQTKAGGDHGEQTLHPAIIGEVVYAEPFAWHLRTGEPVADWKFSRGGHGCGTISGSASQLFYRAGHPAMFDLNTRQARKLSVVNRPGCWINLIPAGGLVLMPEASSGCTCGYAIEATIVFAPATP